MNGSILRQNASSILVATVSSAFGVLLLQVVQALTVAIAGNDVTGASRTVGVMLAVVAVVFIVIALYVGSIVTSNTFATIIAGRTRTIALLRLLGSTASAQRRSVAREGLIVGVVGALLGAVIGYGISAALISIAVANDVLPAGGAYLTIRTVQILPIVAVVLTTWLASWVGARRVLVVTPMQALASSVSRNAEETRRPARRIMALVLVFVGLALLVVGVLVGLVTPLGVLIGVVGGVFSFTGLVLGSEMVMPPALRLIGRMLPSSAPARLAAENSLRYPERASRTTIGIVIAVTLITMFAVTLGSFQTFIGAAQKAQPDTYQGTDTTLTSVVVVFSVLIGFSALIAAIGMVNNLSLSVLQRTRELGLLRALGFTSRQVRGMILAESAQLSVAAVVVGLVLGILYGWAGAQSLLGSINGAPGIVLPTVPWLLLVLVVVGAALLAAIASVAPSRRATSVSPVVALAVD